MKILHIGHLDKFTSDFICFIEDNFNINEHEFRFFGRKEKYSLKSNKHIFIERDVPWKNPIKMFFFIRAMVCSDKIIVHGLINNDLVRFLWLMPWLLNKSYWVVLGLDLYRYQKRNNSFSNRLREFFRRKVIKNIGHIVTYIKGDYDLAKEWYGAKGEYHECFVYTSNLYKEHVVPVKQHSGINILVGNSADPSNNHLDVFRKLENFKEIDFKIFVPLTYGNKAYAENIIQEGRKRFGDNFEPIVEHMPFSQYLEFLGKIDVAIFNHKRQQGMGNLITLLGLGKQVYLRADVTPWQFFKSHNITIFDVEKISFDGVDSSLLDANRKIVKEYFSYKNYMKQLNGIFC